MQNHHWAAQEMADVEARAHSLRFRHHAYNTAVKSQRELINAATRAAMRRLIEAGRLLITGIWTAGHSNHPPEAQRTSTENVV